MYRIYCLNYILNESQIKMKNTNFVTSLLNPLQIIEIHSTGHALPNKIYLIN